MIRVMRLLGVEQRCHVGRLHSQMRRAASKKTKDNESKNKKTRSDYAEQKRKELGSLLKYEDDVRNLM
jgi:hypothetical protein